MTRVWVYDRVSTDATMVGFVDDRIFQSTSINATPHEKPFIMYRQTSDVTTFRGDDNDMVRQTGYMIFAHDVPGDYLRIDAMIERLKVLFSNIVDQDAGVVRSSWIETSEDLRDEDMGTITRFARILVIYKV